MTSCPTQNWSTIAHLALGVTTVFDPSNSASEAFPAGEMQRAGRIIGPRTYSTAEVVYGAKGFGFASIDSYEDALAHVRRLKAQGAHGIKNYNQPRRDQRQQVAAAALAENMIVVAEGASLFTQDITIIAGRQHQPRAQHPAGRALRGRAQPLLADEGRLHADPGRHLWRPRGRSLLAPARPMSGRTRSCRATCRRTSCSPRPSAVRRRLKRTSSTQSTPAKPGSCPQRGVPVSIGAHGQEEGLGSHWELWSFVRGGMSPLEALKAGTITPARHLGFGADIGSLEPGKLADLVILNANPLDDIRNSDKIDRVMLNGRLYDRRHHERGRHRQSQADAVLLGVERLSVIGRLAVPSRLSINLLA